MDLTGMLIVIPSRLAAGETFSIRLKLRGEPRAIACAGGWNTKKPGMRGPFNLNVERKIQYTDDCPPEWAGRLRVDATHLDGPDALVFDGVAQGLYPKDKRPIKAFEGFRWTKPGVHFIRLVDEASGFECWSNPCQVSDGPPAERIYWGDPHWQTFFSDGIRCPEDLYAFARDEAFLDFGALSDHMEGVTDRQWEYFQAVTNDFNAPGRFATLHGQEWTNHNPKVGAPGHRNIYYRGDGGPVLRSDDPACDTLPRLWATLDAMKGVRCVAIPHHSANVVMGVDWEQGWNPRYEKAVEIYSVWGSSERPAEAGNPRPIEALKGEMKGRHVVDALKRGYRFGFVGGGDIHDGRPGDDLHDKSYPPRDYVIKPQGFTATMAPELTREAVFDAICAHRTYATTKRRILLQTGHTRTRVRVLAAAEDGIRTATLMRNGEEAGTLEPAGDGRVLDAQAAVEPMADGESLYVRIDTREGHMAWSSPVWGDELED